MRTLTYKHWFNIKGGRYIWDDPQMFELKRKMLEGKRGYAIIEEETDDASPNQLAYYFGGIIRQECMHSECFAGWTESEIHLHLLKEVRGSVRNVRYPGGEEKLVEMPGDFDLIRRNKKLMADYISDVIAKLNCDYDIFPKPSEHYKKDNKFKLDTKRYK